MNDALLFMLMSLAAYRLWRLWALDVLPPVVWARDRAELAVADRFGNAWADGVTCSWCAGTWCAVFTVAAVWTVRPLPLPALWFGAVGTVVGFLAQYDKG